MQFIQVACLARNSESEVQVFIVLRLMQRDITLLLKTPCNYTFTPSYRYVITCDTQCSLFALRTRPSMFRSILIRAGHVLQAYKRYTRN